MSKTSPEPAASVLELTLTRVFDAPRELVFRMWSDGEHMRRWSAPTGFTIPEGESDFRPGGAWRCLMVAPDGGEHRAGGVYREIVVPERLVMTHGWTDGEGRRGPETVLTVSFEDLGGKTRLTLHQGVFSCEPERDGHLGGWTESLAKLATWLQDVLRQQHSAQQ